MLQQSKLKLIDHSLFLVYAIFVVSIVFSFRAISSIAIGLILITGIIKNIKERNTFFTKTILSPFFISCVLLFVLQCLSLLYSKNLTEGITHIQKVSALIIIPLALFASINFINIETSKKLMFFFTLMLFIASLYCLLIAFLKMGSGAGNSTFFYHDLVKPIKQHAIQFSILVFFVLIFLLDLVMQKNGPVKRKILLFFIIYFSLFLMLLSSKLILVFYIFYLLYFFYTNKKEIFGGYRFLLLVFIPVLMIGIFLATRSPIETRFKQLFSGDANLYKQEKFSQGTAFNSIQFRLLQWKLVPEILNENKKWLFGVSVGDAQDFLNQKYIEKDMYTGKPGTGDYGFLSYHTHNQFLQSLLQNGLAGLIAFSLICLSLIRMAFVSRKTWLSVTVILLIIYCFTDAVLETQYGLIIFIFFPLFSFLSHRFKQ